MKLLDTNILVRYLLGDVSEQSKFIAEFFDQTILQKDKLLVLPQVLIELNYVLSQFYELEKSLVVESLNKILDLSFIEFTELAILSKTLQIYAGNNALSIEDCFYLTYCLEKNLELITFDKKLLNVWEKLK